MSERRHRRRSRRRARGRPPLGLDADRGPLVAAGRRARGRRDPRRARLRRRRRGLHAPTTLLYLGQPFTPSGGGQIQSLATNPKTVSRDHPLRGRARAGRARERASRPGSCAATSRRRRSSRAGQAQEPLAADRDHRATRPRPARRPRRPRTRSRRVVMDRRVDLRRPEDRARSTSRSTRATSELEDIDAADRERGRAAAVVARATRASRPRTS